MIARQISKFFLSLLVFLLIGNKIILGMEDDKKPYIPPAHLAPSPGLIATAEQRKGAPLKYDKEDDVYYQDRDEVKKYNETPKSRLSKSQKRNIRKKEKKIWRANHRTNKQLEQPGTFSESKIVEEDPTENEQNQFTSRFSLSEMEEQLFNLDEWKKKVLKIKGERKLFDELHKSSEIEKTEEHPISYSGTTGPYTMEKECGYKGYLGTCKNIVKETISRSYEGTVPHTCKLMSHRCLCSEVDQLAQALLKEQEKNKNLLKRYKELLKFAQENLQ